MCVKEAASRTNYPSTSSSSSSSCSSPVTGQSLFQRLGWSSPSPFSSMAGTKSGQLHLQRVEGIARASCKGSKKRALINLFSGKGTGATRSRFFSDGTQTSKPKSWLLGKGSEMLKKSMPTLPKRLTPSVRNLLPKSIVPLSEVKRRTKEAALVQARGFWQRNKHIVLGLAAATAVYYIWRTTYGVASLFIDLTESFAELGFLALAIALAGATYLYAQERSRISPNKLYRLAMTRLNTSPSVLEAMGAPVSGSHLQASVLSGGGVRLKGMKVKLRSRRLHMIFRISGPDAKGVVSIEAKKKRGKHKFKLLAVDIVTSSGEEERIFLDGSEKEYHSGGILSELRDPFLRVASAQSMYEREDDEEERLEQLSSSNPQAVNQSEIPAAEPIQEDRQLYFYEWSWEYLVTQLSNMRSKLSQPNRVKSEKVSS